MPNKLSVKLRDHIFNGFEENCVLNYLEAEFSDAYDNHVIFTIVLEISRGVTLEAGEELDAFFAVTLSLLDIFVDKLDLLFDFCFDGSITFEILICLLELCELVINSINSI